MAENGVIPSRDAWNRVSQATKAQESVHRSGGHSNTHAPTGHEIWAKITGETSGNYQWEKVVPDGSGSFDSLSPTVTGSNAYELNATEGIAADTYVRLRSVGYNTSHEPVYVFSYGGQSGPANLQMFRITQRHSHTGYPDSYYYDAIPLESPTQDMGTTEYEIYDLANYDANGDPSIPSVPYHAGKRIAAFRQGGSGPYYIVGRPIRPGNDDNQVMSWDGSNDDWIPSRIRAL